MEQGELYGGQFVGKRVVLRSGRVAKWTMELGVIYTYLRANEMLIFDFLLRRRNAKMELIKWMRENLFSFKQINLSKMWKAIFGKAESGQFDESETVTIVELYSNLFYTLSLEPLLSQLQLSNVLLECLRQAMGTTPLTQSTGSKCPKNSCSWPPNCCSRPTSTRCWCTCATTTSSALTPKLQI